MIQPTYKSKTVEGVKQDRFDYLVQTAALALLPTCLTGCSYYEDVEGDMHRASAIDDAFAIGEAFTRACGFVVDPNTSDSDKEKELEAAIALVRASDHHVS